MGGGEKKFNSIPFTSTSFNHSDAFQGPQYLALGDESIKVIQVMEISFVEFIFVF